MYWKTEPESTIRNTILIHLLENEKLYNEYSLLDQNLTELKEVRNTTLVKIIPEEKKE